MKNILIVTLYGNYNYGNKLQNYAVQEIFKLLNFNSCTLTYKEKKNYFKRFIKFILGYKTKNDLRISKFIQFDNYINKISLDNVNLDYFDFISLGSDQIWNPNDEMSNYYVNLVNSINGIPKISFSASIAVNNIPSNVYDIYLKHFNSIDFISVRENEGKELLKKMINNKNIEVLLDPTMILPTEKWNLVMKKPDNIVENEKYILTYFLGDLSLDHKLELEKIASDNECKIINLYNNNDYYYTIGPSEFLWLIKNAFLICTDSFHASVFSILFKKPFVVYNRKDGQIGVSKTNSRLVTLLNKFDLQNNYYKDKFPFSVFNVDYENSINILNEERYKAMQFLKKALRVGENSEE